MFPPHPFGEDRWTQVEDFDEASPLLSQENPNPINSHRYSHVPIEDGRIDGKYIRFFRS